MTLNLNVKNEEITLDNGDVIIVKQRNSTIHALLYFLEDGGLNYDAPTLVSLDAWWSESVYNKLLDSFNINETSPEKAITFYIKKVLDCEIVEIIPSNEIEIRRI